jgi:hypothetical protein
MENRPKGLKLALSKAKWRNIANMSLTVNARRSSACTRSDCHSASEFSNVNVKPLWPLKFDFSRFLHSEHIIMSRWEGDMVQLRVVPLCEAKGF